MVKQFSKFIVVGGLSTLINYGIFFIGLKLGLYYLLASSIGYVAGLVFGYFLNRYWTFTDQKATTQQTKEMVLYVLVYATSLVLSLGSLHLLVVQLALSAFIANILVIGQSTITNFVGLKLAVFKAHDRS